MKVLTFGTSLTARGGWQKPLQSALQSRSSRKVSIEIVAMSGAISWWGLQQLNRVISSRPDTVLIEFYANDASVQNFVSIEESKDNIRNILKSLRVNLKNANIVVMVMNPVFGIRKLVRPFLDQYIDAHIAIARAIGLEVVDFRPGWYELDYAKLQAAIPDGLHPIASTASAIMVPRLLTLSAFH